METYVHGYNIRESKRLHDQAQTLESILHAGVRYAKGSKVLEAGCGVGAQTVTLAANSPEAEITAIDISADSVAETKQRLQDNNITNVQVEQADIMNLPYNAEAFDHIFLCFVLEHLSNPIAMLQKLRNYLKPSGTLTVIEGDHGSTFFHPDSRYAHEAINCQIELQKRAGGNANIGRELYPLLHQAGFSAIRVEPKNIYVDDSKPELITGFTKNTFTSMIEGIQETAVSSGIITPESFAQGIQDLYRTAEPGGVFNYTFFKGVAEK